METPALGVVLNISEKCYAGIKRVRLVLCQARDVTPACPPLNTSEKSRAWGSSSLLLEMEQAHPPRPSPLRTLGKADWSGFRRQAGLAGSCKPLLPRAARNRRRPAAASSNRLQPAPPRAGNGPARAQSASEAGPAGTAAGAAPKGLRPAPGQGSSAEPQEKPFGSVSSPKARGGAERNVRLR